MYWLYIYSLRFNLKSHHCNYIRHIFEQGTYLAERYTTTPRCATEAFALTGCPCNVSYIYALVGRVSLFFYARGLVFFFWRGHHRTRRVYMHTHMQKVYNMKSFGAHKRICAWWARAHRTHRFLAVCIFPSLLHICIVNQLKPCIMYTHTHTQHISYTFLRI